jgi:hypothetical protein
MKVVKKRGMTRLPLIVASLALVAPVLVACGGDDGGGGMTGVDAPAATDVGFNKPTMAVHANSNDTDLGVADFSCLGTPTADVARTAPIMVTSKVVDFQDNTKAVTGATVVAFAGTDPSMTLGTSIVSAADGTVSFTLPANANTRVGFKMTGGMAGNDTELETYLMNQYFDPSAGATQTLDQIQDVSNSTSGLLQGLLGKEAVPGTGEIAGAFRDCMGHEVSNFVATYSSTPLTATPIAGGDAYYFSSTPLPVRHNVSESSSSNGLFLVLDLPVTATGYVQLWGFLTDADVTAGNFKLLSQLEAPIVANAVVTGSLEPVRQ